MRAIWQRFLAILDWYGRGQTAKDIWDMFWDWYIGPKLFFSTIVGSISGVRASMDEYSPTQIFLAALISMAAFLFLWDRIERRFRSAPPAPKAMPTTVPQRLETSSIPVGEPDPDCWAYDALVYATIGRWPLNEDDRNPENYGLLGGKLVGAAKELRKHARRGRIEIWGRVNPHDLPTQIPKEYWQDYQIFWGSFLRADPEKMSTELATPGAVRRAPLYQALETFKTQVERLWPRSTLVNAALVELGHLRDKGVHFRESAGDALSEGEIGWLREWQAAVILKVDIISPAETTLFRVINKVDPTSHPPSALRNSHLTWLSERIDRIEKIVREHKDKYAL